MSKAVTKVGTNASFIARLKSMKTPGVSVITHEKTPIGVFISIDAFDGFMETLDDLSESDPSFDKDIQEGIQEMKSGKRPKDTVSLDALKKEFYGCRI